MRWRSTSRARLSSAVTPAWSNRLWRTPRGTEASVSLFCLSLSRSSHSYFRKLTLGPRSLPFCISKKGKCHPSLSGGKTQGRSLQRLHQANLTHAVDLFQPQPLEGNKLSDQEIKRVLAKVLYAVFCRSRQPKGLLRY